MKHPWLRRPVHSLTIAAAIVILYLSDAVVDAAAAVSRPLLAYVGRQRQERRPYPGDPDYPWPTVAQLAEIPDKVVCVCGRLIVLWTYPRQRHADGTEAWWVHVDTARRSSHPDPYIAGFAKPRPFGLVSRGTEEHHG